MQVLRFLRDFREMLVEEDFMKVAESKNTHPLLWYRNYLADDIGLVKVRLIGCLRRTRLR